MSSDRPVAATASAPALASRINGAKSRGPKTAAGKARSSRNALKHGLCARAMLLADENAAAFAAFEKALLAELAPEGAMQAVLARQIVSAAWRLARADRIEAEIVTFRQRGDADAGLAVIRDGNTARALPTLLRYRGGAHAELLRTLRALRALQAEARAGAGAEPAPAPAPRRRARYLPARRNEPEQPREIIGLTGRPGEPRHDAPAPTSPGGRPSASAPPAPGASPSRSTPIAPGRAPTRPTAAARSPDPAPRLHRDAPGTRTDAGARPPAGTKPTRESPPAQRLGLRANA
jgi:hypothetical protein